MGVKNPDGSVACYKARLAAKGFNLILGFNVTKMFSPVVKPTATRVILALSKQCPLRQLDVNNVFLNGILQEEVYMSQSDSFVSSAQPGMVCWLHKALYGACFDRLRASFALIWLLLFQI